MRKLFFYSLFYLFSLLCFSQRIITVKAKEIPSIGIMPIKSSIELVRAKNDSEIYDPIKMNWINENVNQASLIGIDSLMQFIKLPSQRISVDSIDLGKYFQELESWVNFFPKRKKITKNILKDFITKIEVSELTSNLIKSKNERYGLCIANLGFTRTKQSIKEYRNELNEIAATGIATSILFWGNLGVSVGKSIFFSALYSRNSYENISSIAIIVDSETKRVVNCFFIASILEPSDKLLNQKITKSFVYPFFSDFWVWYHPEAQQFVVTKRK